MQLSLTLDLFPMLAAVLAALLCGLLGNFLVLRRLSLMGDAISHSVLPGLVIAFLVAGTRSSVSMFIGAAVAGLVTVVLVETVKRLGRVESGAAMGVVFSILFALGVLLIETQAARQVDLDADCILYGQLETLFWDTAPESIGGLSFGAMLQSLPRQVMTLAVMLAVAAVFVAIFFKELRLAAFDPALASAQGFSAGLMHYLLMFLVAGATIASFEAVGSILVIAMLIVPAAAARLLTDRLLPQIVCSLILATLTAAGGYIGSIGIPAMFEKDAVNAAGSIAVMGGVVLLGAAILSPRHGLIAKRLAHRSLRRSIHRDDLLAALFRAEEAGKTPESVKVLAESLPGVPLSRTVRRLSRAGLIEMHGDCHGLTPAGRAMAGGVVRRHRLWEAYLVERAGLAPDHVHATAEQLEHIAPAPPAGPQTDPHGKAIPEPDRL